MVNGRILFLAYTGDVDLLCDGTADFWTKLPDLDRSM